MENHSDHESIPYRAADRPLGIVVGFDGSEQGTLALQYGARAALRRKAVLTVVSAFTLPATAYTTLAAIPEFNEAKVRREATANLLDHAADLLQDYPGEVSYRAEHGDASGVLVKLSSDAEATVIGARGRGGFLGRMLGSVAAALPSHAQSPTIVVPRNYAQLETSGADRFAPVVSSAPVVVGIDGSEHSRVAALMAAQAAQDRGVELHLIMVLPPLDGALLWYPELTPSVSASTAARRVQLKEAMDAERAWVQSHMPDLTVTADVETGEAGAVLRSKTRTSQLVVVGTRGRGGFSSALLGSVSQDALQRAECPVMVVPNLKDRRLKDQPAPMQ